MKTFLAIFLVSTFALIGCTPQVDDKNTDDATKPNVQQDVQRESSYSNQ